MNMLQTIDGAILAGGGALVGLGLSGLVLSLVAAVVVLACKRSHPALQNSALMVCLAALLVLPLALPVMKKVEVAPWVRDAVQSWGSRPVAGDVVEAAPVRALSPERAAVPAGPVVVPSAPDVFTVPVQALPGTGSETRVGVIDSISPWLLRAGALGLLLVWPIGVLVLLGRRSLAWLKLRGFEKRLAAAADPVVVGEWRKLVGEGYNHVRLLEGPAGVSPMTFGSFPPRVVVPADLAANLEPHEIRAVLAHEFAHVRNRDALLGSAQALATMIYWWNPLVHFLVRRLSLVREMVSDRAASGHLDPAAYASSLLRLAEKAGSHGSSWRPAAAHGVSLALGKQLEQRFKMLARYFTTTNQQPKTMKTTIAIAAALAVTALVCATIDTSLADDHPAPATSGQLATAPGGQNAAVIAELQAQIQQLQSQIAQLSGAPQVPASAAAPELTALSSPEAAAASDEPGFFIAGPDGEGKIELDKNGILTITGEKGEGMLRIDTNSGIAKTIITFIERMFETAIVEMERELESVR